MFSRHALMVSSLAVLLALVIGGIYFVLQDSPGPDSNFLWISISIAVALVSTIAFATRPARKIIMGVSLVVLTIGCMVATLVLASINTMFGGSLSEELGHSNILWLIVPALLWVAYYVYYRLD